MKAASSNNPPNVAELAEILVTTDISKICGVTTQTVQSWFDRGVLKAFRTPGGHRRVKREDFLEFLEKFQFPAAAKTTSSQPRILIADDEERGHGNRRKDVGKIRVAQGSTGREIAG